jgi:serine/threonine-protein kinase SRPK3
VVEETEFLVSICCPAQSCHKADLAMKAGFSLSSDSDSSLEPPESGSDSDSGEDRRDYKPGGYNPTAVGDVFKEVFDSAAERVAALKIQKSAKRYTEAAQDEVQMLLHLSTCNGVQRPSAAGQGCVITLLDHFFHHGTNGKHMCMVFEVMGQSLLSLIKHFNYRVRRRLCL